MTEKSSLSSIGRLKKSGRWLELGKVITLPIGLLAFTSNACWAQQPLTPVQHATQASSAATGHNVQSSPNGASSTVSAPTVPSASSIITAAIAASLTKVINAPQLVIDVGSLQNGVYNVNGNLINTSNLVLISSNPNIHTATINSLGGIFNAAGASISTLIPTGYANAVANLNLVLIANTGIYNAGTISSAGALTMSAPVIANVLPSGANPVAPVMSALNGNVNFQSNLVLNQGIVSSALNDINIATLTNNLAINALGGTFSAVNGYTNVGTQNLTDILNIQISVVTFHKESQRECRHCWSSFTQRQQHEWTSQRDRR